MDDMIFLIHAKLWQGRLYRIRHDSGIDAENIVMQQICDSVKTDVCWTVTYDWDLVNR